MVNKIGCHFVDYYGVIYMGLWFYSPWWSLFQLVFKNTMAIYTMYLKITALVCDMVFSKKKI